MALRHGVHKEMEAAADEMLRLSMSGITKHSDKSDVLTPWKEHARRSREVYVKDGTPDATLRRGNFNRAWNSAAPHLNSVEGFQPPKAGQGDPDRQDSGPAPISSVWDSE